MAVNVGTIETQLSADTRQFVSSMRQAQSTFQNTANVISSGSSQATASLQAIEVGVRRLQSTFARSMAAIGAGFILPSIFRAANGAIMGFNQTLDSARISMNTFTGSAEKAEVMLQELQDFAALTPFNFSNLLRTSQQMLAMGVAADELVPRLTAIGDAAAALGGSPETLNRIQRALGQIQAKGRAQAEELLQLAEAGIPAYEYVAQLTGGDIPAALDAMKKGQIDAASAITALLDGMAKDFGGMMEMQSRTLDGAISTVQDYVEMTVGAMGRPIFEAVRDLTLEVADFLGSDAARAGAAQFAENFGAAVKSAAEAIGNFVKTIGPSFVKALEAGYEVARTLAKAFGEAKVALLPFGAAIAAAVIGVGELAGAVTPLLKMFADNKFAVQALAATLVVLAARKRLAADGGGKLVTSLRTTITNFKYMKAEIASANATFGVSATGMKAYGAVVASSMRAAGAAVKGFIISMGPIAAITIGLTALIGLYDKWANRNKALEERTKALTDALQANTDAIVENLKAGEGAIGGYKALEDALFKTGEEGQKMTLAFGALNESASLKNLLEATSNFDDYASKLLRASGATAKQSEELLGLVNNYDTLGEIADDVDRFHFTKTFEDAAGITKKAAASMAGDLDNLQNAVANIDLRSVVDQQFDFMVGAEQVTPLMIAEAKAIAAAAEGFNEMSAAEQAALEYTTLINDVLREQIETAKETERRLAGLANTYSRWASDPIPLTAEGLEEVTNTLRKQQFSLKNLDGSVEAVDRRMKEYYDTLEEPTLDDFIRLLIGANYEFVNMQRAIFDMNNSASDFMDTVANLDGEMGSLVGVGYDLFDMVFEQGQAMRDLGASTLEVQAQQAALVNSFVTSAQAAGYTGEAVLDLLDQLHLLDAFDPDISIGIGLDTAELERQIMQISVSLTQFERDFDRSGIGGAMVDQLQSQLDALRAIASATRGAPSFAGTPIGGGAGIVAGIRDIEDGASDAADAAEELQGYIDDLSYAVAALGEGLVGENFAERLLGASPDEIVKEFEQIALSAMDLADEAEALGVPGGPEFLRDLARIGDKFDELAEASKNFAETQAQLDAALVVYDELESQLNSLNGALKAFKDETDGVATGMEVISEALEGFYEAEGALESLKSEMQALKDKTDGTATGMEVISEALDGFYSAEGALNSLRALFAEFQKSEGLTPKTLADQLYEEIDAYRDLQSELDGIKGSQGQFRQKIIDMFAPTVAGAAGRGGVMGNYRNILRQATEFRDNLVALSNRGFPSDVIRQVVDAGIGGGGKIAKRLLALSSGELQEFFQLRQQITGLGVQSAQIAGDIVFGADIAEAEGAVERQHGVVQDLFRQATAQAEQLYDQQRQAALTVYENAIAQAEQVYAQQRQAAVTAYEDAISKAQENLRQQGQIVDNLQASLASAESYMESLVEAIQLDLRDAFNNFLGGLGGEITRLLNSMSDRLERFRNIAQAAESAASRALSAAAQASASAAAARAANSIVVAGAGGGIGSSLARRASGGPLRAGQLSLVGERGPELFMPRQAGTVIPNGAMGGSTVNYNINVKAVGDPAEAGRHIVKQIQEYERRNGSRWRS